MSAFEPGTSPPLVVLRPGDKVLVALAAEMKPQEVEDTACALRESFPGVEFVVMDGVTSILVGGP